MSTNSNANNAGNPGYGFIGGTNGNGNTFPMQGGGTITIYPYNPIQIVSIPITIPEEAPAKPEEKKKNSDGCNCKKCKEYFPYAEPNQEDGVSLICYACRHGL